MPEFSCTPALPGVRLGVVDALAGLLGDGGVEHGVAR